MREIDLPRCVLEYKDEVDFEDLSLIEDSSEKLKKALFRQRIRPLLPMSVAGYQRETMSRSPKFFVRHGGLSHWFSVFLYFAIAAAAVFAVFSFAARNFSWSALGLASIILLARFLRVTDTGATWRKVSFLKWLAKTAVLPRGAMLAEMEELERLCPGIKFLVEEYAGAEEADSFLVVELGNSAFYLDRLPSAA